MTSAYGEDSIASTKLVLKCGERDPLTIHVVLVLAVA